MNPRPKTVLTFSGGLDSTTLLYHLLDQNHDVLALSVDYGQRHHVELDYANRLLKRLNVPSQIADLRAIASLLGNSSQTDRTVEVPLGHYAAENMKLTVVPNRNMIMLAVATGWAISQRAVHVAYAAHAGDHAIYPDCRREFADTLATAIAMSDWHRVELLRPFVDMSKAQIVMLGDKLGVPFGETWSCYQGGQVHCGACGTCVERREAFLIAGVEDPTDYDPLAPSLVNNDTGELHIDWTRTLHGAPMPEGRRQQFAEVS